MTKKTWIAISILLVVGLILSIAGCATTPAPTPTQTAPKPSATPTPTAPPKATTITPMVLKGQMTLGEKHQVTISFLPFLDEITKRTNGAIKFDIVYGTALAPINQAFDSLSKGMFEWAGPSWSWDTQRDPRMAFTNLPFETRSTAIITRMFYSPEVFSIIDDASKRFNIKTPGTLGTPIGQLLTRNKQVLKIDDFKGLKIRVPSEAEGKALQAYGATPSFISGAETSVALSTGVLDGAMYAYYTLDSYKLWDAIKYITEVDFNTVMTMFSFNLDTWNKFSPEVQKIILDTAKEVLPQTTNAWVTKEADFKAKAISQGITVVKMAPEDRAVLVEKGGLPIWQDAANKIGGAEGQAWLDIVKKWAAVTQ